MRPFIWALIKILNMNLKSIKSECKLSMHSKNEKDGCDTKF
jgi:hypothetical protein